MNDLKFSNLLLSYMSEHNLTKAQFAHMLGLSRQTLDNWLDHDNATVKAMLRMVSQLNIDLLDLQEDKDRVIPANLAKKLNSEERLLLTRLARMLADKK